MRSGRPRTVSLPPAGSRPRGATLPEACAALALSAATALAALSGIPPLACALRAEAARGLLQDAMWEAGREAYASGSTTSVETRPGAAVVVLHPRGLRLPLGDGVRITSAPADADVRFHAGGTADNATVRVACGDSERAVVVNQRGVVR